MVANEVLEASLHQARLDTRLYGYVLYRMYNIYQMVVLTRYPAMSLNACSWSLVGYVPTTECRPNTDRISTGYGSNTNSCRKQFFYGWQS